METIKLRNNKTGIIITFYLNEFGYLFHDAYASSKQRWVQCFIDGNSVSADSNVFEKVARGFYRKHLKPHLEKKIT